MTSPAPLMPTDTARVTCTGATGTGDVWAAVHHVKGVFTTAEKEAQIAAAFTTMYTLWNTQGLFPAAWTLNGVSVRRNVGGQPQQTEYPANVVAADKPAAPPQIAVCASHRSAVASRRGRGRTFIGPITSQIIGADGRISSVAVGHFVQGFINLRTALASTDTNHAVYSRLDNVSRLVLQTNVGPIPDTIRRRRSTLRG